MGYAEYLNTSLEAVRGTISRMECRPILFMGSGITRRYLGGPSWRELLEYLVDDNPLVTRSIDYYLQAAKGDFPAVASMLEDAYYEYAWQHEPGDRFPIELYDAKYPKEVFLKHHVCWSFERSMSSYRAKKSRKYSDELGALTAIEPHAIITTNYDCFLEERFPGFEAVIGQQIVRRTSYASIGEILKIHGCASDPLSIVITSSDYDNFVKRKKYLTAKLLTYLVEFPVFIMGYSLTDSNIRGLFSDIAEIFPDDDNVLVRNIWFIDWADSISPDFNPPSDKYVDIGEGRSIRVNYLLVSDFQQVFGALSQRVAVKHVDVKLLRALASNVYDVVKSKSAKADLAVNIATLNGMSDSGALLNVLGFGFVENPNMLTELFPHFLTDVAAKLGYSKWHGADRLIKQVLSEKGIDIRGSNNEYHQNFGKDTAPQRRYSEKTVELLKKVKRREAYTVSV